MHLHELHKKVGNAFCAILSNLTSYKLELDEACDNNVNKKKHLPFFISHTTGNDTEISNVDLIVVKDQKAKIICEIEESDITPVRIFGKIFTTATAKMCKLKDGTIYKLDDHGIFIQVLSSKKLNKDHSKKKQQGENIQKAINAILKSNGAWIKEYHLIYGDVDDFKVGNDGYKRIVEIIIKIN
jgi:hypothetical protein